MLYLLVNSHTPDNCVFRGPDERTALIGGLDRFREAAAGHEVTFQKWWFSRTSHEVFMIVEAPNPHAVESALIESGLVGRTHSRILPVVTVDAAADLAAGEGA